MHGGPCWTRTNGPLIKSFLLFQKYVIYKGSLFLFPTDTHRETFAAPNMTILVTSESRHSGFPA